VDLYKRQQFDFLLVTAADRFVERIVQRNAGAANALARLQADPNGEGIWLDEFVQAIFQDFLLDNTAGACFVLEALEKRTAEPPPSGKIETMLVAMAQQAFGALLAAQVGEALDQASMYEG
jgi:hypothetical protein